MVIYVKELVFIKKDDVFTNSKIIAKNAEVNHYAIRQLIDKHKSDFEEFGSLKFTHLKCENSGRGRPEKLYLLNEQQATLLLTYLKNQYHQEHNLNLHQSQDLLIYLIITLLNQH